MTPDPLTKLRCAILDDYQGVALTMADWSSIAGAVDVRAHQHHIASDDALVETVGDAEILVVMRERTPLRAHIFARLPRLRLIVTSGMRNASIDLDAAAAHGVVVCGTASRSEPPVELTWALILALARHVVDENASLRGDGPWQHSIGDDLHGQRLGLLGLGKIGTRVARVGLAFGMDVVAWSQNLTDERAAAAGTRRASSKEQLLEESDVVSLHLVLSERTRHLLGADELRRMRPTAYLINTSRAGLIDPGAMLEALRSGWIAGAAVDVFDEEPLPAGHELRTAPRLLATPHLGYVSRANYAGYFREAVEDIQAFLDGAPIRTLASE